MTIRPESIEECWHDLVQAALDQPRPTPALQRALQIALDRTKHGARARWDLPRLVPLGSDLEPEDTLPEFPKGALEP